MKLKHTKYWIMVYFDFYTYFRKEISKRISSVDFMILKEDQKFIRRTIFSKSGIGVRVSVIYQLSVFGSLNILSSETFDSGWSNLLSQYCITLGKDHHHRPWFMVLRIKFDIILKDLHRYKVLFYEPDTYRLRYILFVRIVYPGYSD